MWCFVSLILVVHTSAIDCIERLVSKMAGYVSSGTLNPTHSLAGVVTLFVDGLSISSSDTQCKFLPFTLICYTELLK